MAEEKLFEKQAAKAGLGDIKVVWLLFDGGNVINDAMLAGELDIAGTGAPGFITLWAKAKGNPKLEVIGVSGLSATSLYLNTSNPAIKSLADFTANDRIALPGIKTSLSAVVPASAGSRGLAPCVRATAAAASASVLAPNRVASWRSAVPSSWRRACAANRVLEFRPFGCRLNRGRDTPPGLRSPPNRRRPRPRYRPVCDSRAHRNNGARGGAERQVHADLPGRCGVAG